MNNCKEDKDINNYTLNGLYKYLRIEISVDIHPNELSKYIIN